MNEKSVVSGEPTQGVYYSPHDYAGFWRRLLVDIIDFTLLIVATIAITLVAALILPTAELVPHVWFWAAMVLGFVYLVLLKRSRFRTLGYRVGGIRIVNIQGERPSLWALTIRALFASFGPINMLIDVIWLTNDSRRQALRDKFAHTYVIREGAAPLGHGAIVYASYTVFAWNFLFAEVRPRTGEMP